MTASTSGQAYPDVVDAEAAVTHLLATQDEDGLCLLDERPKGPTGKVLKHASALPDAQKASR